MGLALLFLVIAFFYACVGFGGGSSYNALLVLTDTDYRILPFIALSCNIIVVSGGVFHFIRAGHLNVREILPWIILSVPAAWLGGYVDISKQIFTTLLGLALLLSGVRMLLPELKKPLVTDLQGERIYSAWVPPLIGGSLGFVAGLTGIGGGIFLAPVLHLLRWSHARNIAGICSLFILVNSTAGLLGHIMKAREFDLLAEVSPYWLLFPAVLLGGQLGSWMGSSYISLVLVKRMTALLILYVSIRLLWYVISGTFS